MKSARFDRIDVQPGMIFPTATAGLVCVIKIEGDEVHCLPLREGAEIILSKAAASSRITEYRKAQK